MNISSLLRNSIAIIIMSLAIAGCFNQDGKTKIVIVGSTTIQPIIENIVESYQPANPDVTLYIQGGGSSVGISSVSRGMAQIGMVSRKLKGDEQNLSSTVLAYDGIALIVHESNPIKSLTAEQVKMIYSGKIKNWAALSNNNAPITVISKEEGRGTRSIFDSFFKLKGQIIAGAIVIGPNGQAIVTTAGNPNAIAYVSINAAIQAQKLGTPIILVALDGIQPTTSNVTSGTYPLQRELLLVTKGKNSEPVQKFIDYVLGNHGKSVIVELGFTPRTSN